MWKQAIYHKTTPVLVSLILCLVSSVYPPFKFGEGRHKFLVELYKADLDSAPLSIILVSFSHIYEKRVFILKLSPGTFEDKTKPEEHIDEQVLIGNPLLTDRRLLIDRLIVEYIIAALIGGIIYALQRSGRKEQENKTR
jgi:hypothetical protein